MSTRIRSVNRRHRERVLAPGDAALIARTGSARDNEGMQGQEPWDARLLKWMSKDSGTVRAVHRPPRFWVGLAAAWGVLALASALWSSRDWIWWTGIAGAYAVIALARWLRVRGRGEST